MPTGAWTHRPLTTPPPGTVWAPPLGQVDPETAEEYWRGRVTQSRAATVVVALRWVRRDADKPHRCPSCHRVADGGRERYGPRTVFECDRCGIRWRAGSRAPRFNMRVRQRLAALGIDVRR